VNKVNSERPTSLFATGRHSIDLWNVLCPSSKVSMDGPSSFLKKSAKSVETAFKRLSPLNANFPFVERANCKRAPTGPVGEQQKFAAAGTREIQQRQISTRGPTASAGQP
jgi:hypothetical protein